MDDDNTVLQCALQRKFSSTRLDVSCVWVSCGTTRVAVKVEEGEGEEEEEERERER